MRNGDGRWQNGREVEDREGFSDKVAFKSLGRR